MQSLSTQIILQHLTADKQNELLTGLLEKNNELETVYTVHSYLSFPTGGDYCHHDEIIKITGNYKEAKALYDEKTNRYLDNIIPDDYRSPDIEEYTLYYGHTQLERTCFNFADLNVFRRNDRRNESGVVDNVDNDNAKNAEIYPDYELTYPLYLVKFQGNYDIITYDGPFHNYSNALNKYISIISKMERNPTGWSCDEVFLIEIKDRNGKRTIVMHHKKKEMDDDDLNSVDLVEVDLVED